MRAAAEIDRKYSLGQAVAHHTLPQRFDYELRYKTYPVFSRNTYRQLNQGLRWGDKHTVLLCLGRFIFLIIDEMEKVQAERDSANLPAAA